MRSREVPRVDVRLEDFVFEGDVSVNVGSSARGRGDGRGVAFLRGRSAGVGLLRIPR